MYYDVTLSADGLGGWMSIELVLLSFGGDNQTCNEANVWRDHFSSVCIVRNGRLTFVGNKGGREAFPGLKTAYKHKGTLNCIV